MSKSSRLLALWGLIIKASVCMSPSTAVAAGKTIGVVMTGNIAYYKDIHKAFSDGLAAEGFGPGSAEVVLQTPRPEPMSWSNSMGDEYRAKQIAPCTNMHDGQEFVADSPGAPSEGFCAWAWANIHKEIVAIMSGGDFEPGVKQPGTAIACCTDGFRPVVFKIERIEAARENLAKVGGNLRTVYG